MCSTRVQRWLQEEHEQKNGSVGRHNALAAQPDANGVVLRAADNKLLVGVDTEHRVLVSRELLVRAIAAAPNNNQVIGTARHDNFVVVDL